MIIDGKALATQLRKQIAEDAQQFCQKYGRKVGLAVVLLGQDKASKIYVASKIRACKECNIESFAYYLPEQTTQAELLDCIAKLNCDQNVDGILVQLPLPKHIDEQAVILQIDSNKDADGFCVSNAGALFLGQNAIVPCTPRACIELIKSCCIDICGKHAVVLGRSNIVGKPVAQLLLQEHATVTICHSRTQQLEQITRQADILIAAIGKPKFVTEGMLKQGAVVIDVGINRLADGSICGDVDFENAQHKCAYITPVPGGVGPMTITCLMQNAVASAYKNIK